MDEKAIEKIGEVDKRIVDSVLNLEAGYFLNKRVALDVCGFKYEDKRRKVRNPKTHKVVGESKFRIPDGRPAMLPPSSQDANIAGILMKEVKNDMDIHFDAKNEKFTVMLDQVDGIQVEGKSFAEVVSKALVVLAYCNKIEGAE